jgi:predicted transcriptional regulator
MIVVGDGGAVPPELARLLADAGYEISPARPVTLRALRESVGRTQGEVATRVSMTQPQLSRVEARRDHLISTVRKYVRALDGEIEVAAIVNGSRFVLRDV